MLVEFHNWLESLPTTLPYLLSPAFSSFQMCHFLIPFLYYQIKMLKCLIIEYLKESYDFVLFCTLKAWRWCCTLQSSCFAQVLSWAVVQADMADPLRGSWRELGGFPTGIHHTSKSPLTLESALTYHIPGESLFWCSAESAGPSCILLGQKVVYRALTADDDDATAGWHWLAWRNGCLVTHCAHLGN